MVSVVLCILDSIALIETVFKMSQMYALVLHNNGFNSTMVGPRVEESKEDKNTTVEHYARHELCKDFDGKQYFYKAMKSKFCSLKLTFIAGHVIDLCEKRDHTLDKWVAELFDFDGNGVITHYEKTFYEEIEEVINWDKI